MGYYKGKREASRSGNIERRRIEADPFQSAGQGVGDPFASDGTSGKKKKGFSERMKDFWDSGKGQILLVVVLCIAILGTATGIAISMWVKEPTLPNVENNPKTTPSTDKISTTPNQNTPETDELGSDDDELYPDDGYDGDMPTVSGNRKEGMYTFMLVGTDMDDGNTDTIMVVSYDTKNQDVAIMSIPRDTMINESWDIKKINSVYSRYTDGIGALKKRLKTLVGFTPDFYIKVDLSMFVKLVDLIGGVEFDVPQDMNYDDPYQDLHIHLKKGVQTLDGEKAMELVRFRRYSEGDIKRVEVQQEFIKALIKECLSLKHWGKIKAYIDLAMENVETDLEFGSVVWFAANVLGINSGVSALNMDDVYTCTLPGNYWGSAWSRSTNQEQSYVTIYPKEVVKVVNEYFNPYEQQVTTSMLDAMSILSNGTISSSTGSLRDTTHNAVVASMRGEGSSSKTKDKDTDSSTTSTPTSSTTVTPKKDSSGKYYILDEDGKKVYTDKNGNPVKTTDQNEPVLPNSPSTPGTAVITDPDPDRSTDTSQDTSAAPEVPDSSGEQTPNQPANNDPPPATTSDPSQDPEPQLPDETTSVPQTPEPVPEPEPTPAPEPEPTPEPEPVPTPEPVLDTDIPEWLLS